MELLPGVEERERGGGGESGGERVGGRKGEKREREEGERDEDRSLSIFLFYFREEAFEYVEIGSLNGLFVLGRTMGFIGENYLVTPTHTHTLH